MRWLTKSQAAEITGLSPHTLRRYRERGVWIQGVHYVKLAQNAVRYNEGLLTDWMANRHNPIAHQQTIEAYLIEISANGQTNAKGKRKRPPSR